jgi:hypothetical protein
MSDPFLSESAVKRLTGRERPSAQLRWCRDNGVRAWLSARNEVVIPVAAVNGKPAAEADTFTPDFTVFAKG